MKITEGKFKSIVENIIRETLLKQDPSGTIYDAMLDSKPYMIYEGLIKTYPIYKVVDSLKLLFDLYDGNDETEKRKILYWLDKNQKYNGYNGIIFLNKYSQNNTERIEIKVSQNDFNQNDFDRYFLKYGWFCGLSEKVYGYDDIIRFGYEKKFDIEVTEDIKELKYIYHITPNIYLNKINKVGLKPKVSSWNEFNNPERIYFFTKELSHEIFFNWAYDFNWNKNINRHLNNGWSLLKIDVSSLTNNPSFYYDPRMKDGIYTMDVISSDSIEMIDFISIDDLIV